MTGNLRVCRQIAILVALVVRFLSLAPHSADVSLRMSAHYHPTAQCLNCKALSQTVNNALRYPARSSPARRSPSEEVTPNSSFPISSDRAFMGVNGIRAADPQA